MYGRKLLLLEAITRNMINMVPKSVIKMFSVSEAVCINSNRSNVKYLPVFKNLPSVKTLVCLIYVYIYMMSPEEIMQLLKVMLC